MEGDVIGFEKGLFDGTTESGGATDGVKLEIFDGCADGVFERTDDGYEDGEYDGFDDGIVLRVVERVELG